MDCLVLDQVQIGQKENNELIEIVNVLHLL